MNRSVKDKLALAATLSIAGIAGIAMLCPAAHATPRPAAAPAALSDDDDPDVLYDEALADYNNQQFDQSISVFNKAIKLRPKFADAYFYRAQDYHQKGKVDQAIQDLSAAVAIKTKLSIGYFYRGCYYEQQKNFASAVQDFKTTLDLKPNQPAAMMHLGTCAYQQGQYDDAIAAYKRFAAAAAASTDPADQQLADSALLYEGLCYTKKTDFPDAIASYTSYIQAKPTDPDGYLDRADAEHGAKQYDSAIADYQQYLTLHPQDTDNGYAHQQIAIDQLNGNHSSDAIAAYKTYLATNPNDKNAWNNLMIAYQKTSDSAGAADAASHVITLDPTNAAAYTVRADAYMKTGQQANAIADYTKVISLNSDPVNYYNRGVAYAQMKNWALSKADFVTYLQAKPDDANGLKGRGIAESNLQDYPSAVADYTAYLTQKPDDTDVQYALAVANFHAGNNAAALTEAQAYLAKKPDDKDAQQLVVTLQVGSSDPTAAIPGLIKLTQSDPTNATNFYNLGVAYAKNNQFDEAADAFGKAAAIKPDADTYNQEGIAFNKANKPTDAADAYGKAIAADPQHAASSYLNRGDLDMTGKQYDKAVTDYTQYLALSPTATPDQTAPVYVALGDAYIKVNDYPNALATYNKVLATNPSNADALYGRGVAEYNTKDYDKAIADLSAATKLPNADPDAALTLAHCYEQKQDFPDAVAAYTTYIGSNPKDQKDLASAYLNRGLAYDQSGDLDKAVADYDQAATLNPADPLPLYDKGLTLVKQAKKAEDASDGSAAQNGKAAAIYQTASDTFKKYLAVAPPTDPEVAKVQALLPKLAAKIKDLQGG